MPAYAYTLGPVDVGGLDTFIAGDVGQGNPAGEATWVQGVVGDPTIDWTVSLANVPYSQVDGETDIWAFSLLLSPEYYIVKNTNAVALFQNVASLDWGVFQENAFLLSQNVPSDPWVISHVTSLDGSGGGSVREVPEPTLPLLMGIGLIGLAFVRKVDA